MSETYKLPGSSYKELQKIIQAYGTNKKGVGASLDELSQSSGAPTTVISRNNAFLTQVKIIVDGKKKNATDLGRQLASAYVNNIESEICRIWKEIVEADDFLMRMISIVRIKGEMEKGEFIKHIVYSSGVVSNNNSRSGAGTIIDIFKLIGVIEEHEGKCVAKKEEEVNSDSEIHNKNEVSFSNDIDLKNSVSENTPPKDDKMYVTQPYICESGKEAKIIVPTDATDDDMFALRDLLEIMMKRKFKIDV